MWHLGIIAGAVESEYPGVNQRVSRHPLIQGLRGRVRVRVRV